MVKHYNPSISKDVADILNTKTGNHLQTEVFSELVATLQVQPYINVYKSATTATTMFTTPADKDFYLTNVAITGAALAGGAAGNLTLGFTLADGTTGTVLLAVAPDVATGSGNNTVSIQYPMRGLKLARSSVIQSGGSLDVNAWMFAGYTVEVVKNG